MIETGKAVVWSARLDDGGHALAVVNVSDAPAAIRYPWATLGIKGTKHQVRDLWEKRDEGTQTMFRVSLAPHASVLLRVD